MGVLAVAIGAGQVGGMLHVGLLADWLGAAAAVQLMAAEGLLALAVTVLLWPEMRRASRPGARRCGRRRLTGRLSPNGALCYAGLRQEGNVPANVPGGPYGSGRQPWRSGSSDAATEAPQKLGRKAFECRAVQAACRALPPAGLGQAHRASRRGHLRGPRCRRQGRRDQAHHRAGEPPGVSRRGLAGADRAREVAALHAALRRASAGGRRDRAVRSQLVHRAGVERVMGISAEEQAQASCGSAPASSGSWCAPASS